MLRVSSLHPLTRALPCHRHLTCSLRWIHVALDPRRPLGRAEPPHVAALDLDVEHDPRVVALSHDVQPKTTPHKSGQEAERASVVETESKTAVAEDVDLDGRYANGLGRVHRRDIKPIRISRWLGNKNDAVRTAIRTIATTQSADDAWEAHRVLLTLRSNDSGPAPESTPGGSHNAPHPQRPRAGPIIPFAFSHRLARLLAAAKPRTRTQFLRLLTVLADVKKDGGTVHRWEWNALIDCAGRGWRKTRPEDYKAALDVFEDMISQPPPEEPNTKDGRRGSQPANAAPDIVTYTTLLNIAARTLTPDILRHASTLLQESAIPHNRVTHLATLRFFTRTNRLSGVRSTVMRMREQGFALGLDGANACLTAFARNARVDVAATIYRVLRHNAAPEGGVGAHDIDAAVRYLDTMEGIVIPAGVVPDRVTYTAMIQAFAYHGDLIQALHVFTHMLSSPDLEPFAPRISRDENGELVPVDYPTTLPVFRALFLGFARHAQPPQSPSANTHKFSLAARLESRDGPPSGPKSPWTVANLRSLFKTFLELPAGTRPSDRTIYWILVAFSKATGDDDVKLRQIWEQLQSRFEGRWGGRIELSRKRIYGELPSEEEQWEDV